MKFWKKALLYLAFILGILVVIGLVCFAIMYFAPGTPILGFEYFSYSKKIERIYPNAVEGIADVSDIKAFEIISDEADVYVYPNSNSDEIRIFNTQGLSGFAKSINAGMSLDIHIETKSFEESMTEYKTLCINLSEPKGWVSKGVDSLYVYIPDSLTVNTIYARSNDGNVYYSSVSADKTVENTLACSNLYLRAGGSGKIAIENNQPVYNYYLATDSGKVTFSDVTTLNANTVKFETKSGIFDFTNATQDATLVLTDSLIINSTDNYGPTIKVNKLYGNLKADVNRGYFKIEEIGKYGDATQVCMNINHSTLNFGTCYAFLSILGDGSNVANNVSIDALYYTAQMNTMDIGAGGVRIDKLNANVSFDSTSGSIYLSNVTADSNIYIYTQSGAVDINYEYSETNHDSTKLTILSDTGDIRLKNVSCAVDIEIMSDSAKSMFDVVFGAVAHRDNKIYAGNRRVNLTLKGVSDSLQFRIVSTHNVAISEDTVGKDISTPTDEDGNSNNDCLLETAQYGDYTYCYRVGYTRESANYNTNAFDLWGKLLIKTSGDISLDSQL